MRSRILQHTLFILFCFFGSVNLMSQVTVFAYTGGLQTYTVPVGVTAIQIECWGAQGGGATGIDGVPAPGGLGGYAIGELTVTPGQVLNVYVGGAGAAYGAGGYNGGGMAGTNYGAAGGGASDVRTSPYALANRVIVGAGGGGGAFGSYGNPGGHGGGLIGGMGSSGGGFTAGSGGTQVAGGAAGCCYGAATAGTFGLGAGPGDYHNAGGGGGWYGGGSGAGHAGAGGGSSYIAGVAAGSTTTGIRSGNGQVTITVLCSGLDLEPVATEICEGEEIILDASSIGGGTITWDLGVTNGVSFAPPLGTTTYTATSSDPEDCELTIDITVNPLPVVVATATDVEVCEGDAITLTGSGADTYLWDLGVIDGDPFGPPLGTTTYTVTGESLLGCVATASIDILVNPTPVVTATADFIEVCLGESVVFTGGGADTYVWDMGVTDGVPFTPAAYGTVTYTVTGTDVSGCESTATIDVTVNDAPTVTASADDTEVCEGDMVTLTGGGALTYTWDGGVTDGVAFTPVLGTTTFTVTGATISGCENTASIDITVNALPIVTASADDTEICLGEEIILTGGGAATYVWDGGATDGVPFAPAVLGTTTYSVTGTGIGGCEATASIDILVEDVPAVTATASPLEICLGETITFNGGGADIYSWDGGVTNGIPYTPASVGTFDYTVTGTTSGSGCENTAVVSFTVNPTPTVTASATSTEVCFGESTTLTGGGADTYTWDGGITNGIAFTPGVMGATTYTVTGTNAFGCESTASITVTVIDCEPVVPLFSMPEKACVGDCFVITDESTGAVTAWSWDFGGAATPGTSSEQNPLICVTTAGSFTVELTSTSATGAISSVSHVINVFDNPILVAARDTIIDLGGSAVLVGATVSSGTFEWIPSKDVECEDCQLTNASPAESTTYTVYFEDDNGCTASDTVMVLVNFVEGVGVPTAFSPNGDGFNDILFIKGYALEAVSLVVYNRYGEIVFETNDQNIGWDGTFKNREQNPGVFTWVLQYQFINGQSGSQKGNTTLIR